MKIKKLLLNLLGIIIFIALWQLLHDIKANPAIPSVSEILNSLFNIILDHKFYSNVISTVKLVFIGVLMATIVGIGTAFIMSFNEKMKHILMPVIECLRNIPAITLFPMLLVLYGIGDMSRIFVIFWTAYPSIIIQTYYGLTNVDNVLVEAAQSCGANKLQIYRHILFPLATSQILTGIKIAIGSGFVAIVVAEMLGASKGLGYMILWCTNAFKYPETYAYIIIVALIGGLFNLIMNRIIKFYERKY